VIILDTNVVSEPLRPHGNPRVQAWLDGQAVDTLYMTAVNLSELLLGVELLPAGKRRQKITEALQELLSELFAPRILPFDAEAAKVYSRVVSRAQARGLTIGVADAQIASIALNHGFAVATRDTAPFKAADVPIVIDPWRA
jgi:hypothetical protein